MATELAQAFVQIMPSAKGMKGSLSNLMGGEATSAGQEAGSSFGGKMVGMIKGVLATAAIGKALAATIKEGAALEQSLGGIETLFKDNADKVKGYAAEAYKTAGLSANEYMQAVTGFSASLLQGLKGDTSKAADVANMALTDMSDNANKMGTSMEAIQFAYQGFAKQNYTMLDNLKLGYGGTKTEMQRLLADATKISGVKYNLDNLADVYNAIHVIQGKLDITGTTAKEAASTISGSWAAMGSAFKNVMGYITLGMDIKPALAALAQTTATFLMENLIPAIWNILSALPGALLTFFQEAAVYAARGFFYLTVMLKSELANAGPQFLEMATQLITQFASGITTQLPAILSKGQELIVQLVNGIYTTLPGIYAIAGTAMVTFMQAAIALYPSVIETGKNILMSIISGIRNAFPQVIVTAGQTIATMLGGLLPHLPAIIAAGFDLIITLIRGIGNAAPDIIAAMGKAARLIWDEVEKVNWFNLGAQIISGLINGIGSMAGALWDAATNIARSALNAIKGFFGIKSPSRLMRDEVGKYIPLGIAVGIENNTRPIKNAMRDLTALTTGTLQTDLAVGIRRNNQLAYAGYPGDAASAQGTSIHQTIYTRDSLSPAEITQEGLNFLSRARWKNP